MLLYFFIFLGLSNPTLAMDTTGYFVYEMEYKGITLKSDLNVICFEEKYYVNYKKIYEDCFEEMWTVLGIRDLRSCPTLEELLAEKENIFLLLNNNEIIGSVTCPKNEIDILVINKKYQNQGFAKKLGMFAISYMQKRGDDPIRCHVKEWNKNAKDFYERYGFVVTKKEIDKSIPSV